MEMMSCGLIWARLPASPKGKPSTTRSGALEPFTEELPLTRTMEDAPGSWELLVTWTPATRPCMRDSMELEGLVARFSGDREATEPVRSLFFMRP